MVKLGKLQLFVCVRECVLNVPSTKSVSHKFECTLKQGFDGQPKVAFFKLLPILSHTNTRF